ncbi:hypothetical protein DSOL_4506 [Desulfosporosinus metallidurans]|uniref:Uncharacterized protein n=1 Tax=Desulfosporosinus metallidurans TaxID=1888891 RepID=A0A1Q8QJL0_9FIRM|nr:hypothetical protein DSOL_4506 [Desulfosporosinus metallidurans]
MKNTMDEGRLQIEVPSTHFLEEWLKIFTKIHVKHFRKEGFSKKAAETLTREFHKEWGVIRDLRIK